MDALKYATFRSENEGVQRTASMQSQGVRADFKESRTPLSVER